MVEERRTISQQEFMALDQDAAAILITSRFHALGALGCDTEAAVVIAVHPEIDMEEASDLVRSGLDAPTVVRILLEKRA